LTGPTQYLSIPTLQSNVWGKMEKTTVAFSKDSSNLFFHILTKCNLSCTHCYINKNQHGEATLPIETIRNWLFLYAPKARQTNVIFLGGEPTLHPDLYLAVKEAKRLEFKSITIYTNGYLFHDLLDKIHPGNVDFISFSLDGATRNTNDNIRGDGSFDTVLRSVELARAKHFSCSMIYTVSDMNIHEIERMPDLIKKLGITHFFIQVIGMRGKSSKAKGKLQVDRETWLSTIPRVAKKVTGYGINVTYPKVFLDPLEEFQCAGNVADNSFVFPNGRVYQCPVCEDFPLHSHEISSNELVPTGPVNEKNLFQLDIPEGCVMNKLAQSQNLEYNKDGTPVYKIACCMLKEEILVKKDS
jgi:MoaA/NifB/PqqE/SkfB family radical SAM enzyme